ncbi:ABC transporter ATP-binding protein [Ktedonobacter racemifer]|uniref:ABC transporter related protein n=1 Tax=Ktedonobacter racemifer DSM 44963 TaxID=485913 RepID=D6U4C3_KTERA|nr:ABC transporter ATP-binding protein [Ktedonobacter racemifer]EFH81353.1 ABC transporter related protein [Ktedonobacter racemifer DSM 44963]
MTLALEANQLGKKYGKRWALQNCDLHIPEGGVTGLVGLNGAGKTTLLHLGVGLLAPSAGSISVLGETPAPNATALIARIGFVAQERPLYRSFSVKDTLTLGRKLNTTWDNDLAERTLARLDISLKTTVGKLSGGQRALLALVMALAKRPRLLLLDEPFANVDPLARRELVRLFMDAVASNGASVVISSHHIADLEIICDRLVLLSQGQVKVEEDLETFVTSHKLLIGPHDDFERIASEVSVIQAGHTGRQSNVFARLSAPFSDPRWVVQDLSLEDIMLAYLDTQSPLTTPNNHSQQEVAR